MTTEWKRNVGNNLVASTTKTFKLFDLPDACTVLGGWWHAYANYAELVGVFPPGTALTMAGLIVKPAAGTGITGPITNPTESWMDLRTMEWRGNVAISASTAWFAFASTGETDVRFEAARKNVTPSSSLYICMETLLAGDESAAFGTGFSAWVSGSAFLKL